MDEAPFNQRGRPGRGPTTRDQRREAYAEAELAQTPEGAAVLALKGVVKGMEADLRAAKAQIAAMKGILDNLQGENGIEIKLPIIRGPRREVYQSVSVEMCDKATGLSATHNFLIK